MRTTVDLAPALYQRVKDRATTQRQSISATVAGLVAQGLDIDSDDVPFEVDPSSGFPVVSIGRTITTDEVARLIEED